MLKKTLQKLDYKALMWAFFLVSIISVEIYTTSLIPEAKKGIFTALETHTASHFLPAMGFLAGVFAFFSVAQGLKEFAASYLAIIVRTAMTKVIHKKWVKSADLTKFNHPSQRINEDIRLCTESTLLIAMEVIISGVIVLVLIGDMMETQGLLLIAAGGYTVISMLIAWAFNKPLTTRDIDLQVAEAAHRESLHKIELGLGDFTSKPKYLVVVKEYLRYAKVKLTYTMFYKLVMGFSGIVPLFILVPQYFAGSLQVSDVVQGVSQFELVVVNLGILLTLYNAVIKAQASWMRVIKFYRGT